MYDEVGPLQSLSEEQQRHLNQAVTLSIENSKDLPIAKHKHEIMDKLNKNQVLIVSGDTGCGKTTQVPKYILASSKESMIICT